MIVARSTAPDCGGTVSFSLDRIKKSPGPKWGNYVKAVARELVRAGKNLTGAEVVLESDLPLGAGLSSSASLELCLAFGLLALAGEPADREETARLCQRAENSDLVNSPCGFLDQGTISFARKGKLVLFDFAPPVKIKLISARLSGTRFVVAVDRTVKRNLGESGYPARRKACEQACKRLKINSLRELNVKGFEAKKQPLEPLMRKRVEHVVYENQRVLAAVKSLEAADLAAFGRLLNESGRSALDLYQLDEGTPELRFLVEAGRALPGVLGCRNMGGGFSAVVLALVREEKLAQFKQSLAQIYQDRYRRPLELIEFVPSAGIQVFHPW